MKKPTTGAGAILAATLMLGACSGHNDADNATNAVDTTVLNDEALDANATTDNFGAADLPGNALDGPDAALNGTDAGNASGTGNGL